MCSFILIWATKGYAQSIPSDRVLKTSELKSYLKPEVQDEFNKKNSLSEATLATYFRDAFKERFFYDFESFYDRLDFYNKVYKNENSHASRAVDHLTKYPDSTQ